MKYVGYTVSLFVVIFASVAYSAFALMKLWAWFVVPTFGLPALSLPVAAGLALLVGYMTQDMSHKKDDSTLKERMVWWVTMGALKPSLALLFGWIYKAFMP